MNKKLLHISFLLIASQIITSGIAIATPLTEQQLTQARKVVKTLAHNLQKELKQSMAEGGPEKALQQCHLKAPDITQQTSMETQWEVGRTSLKLRNAKNKPDQWEKEVLQQFEKRRSQGEAIAGIEYGEVISTTQGKQLRYMKAIATKGLCLTCHGENIAPELKHSILESYPNDQAIGFHAGQIRGAFTVKREL